MEGNKKEWGGGEGVVIRNSRMRGGITQQTDGPLIRSKPDDCIQFEKSPMENYKRTEKEKGERGKEKGK